MRIAPADGEVVLDHISLGVRDLDRAGHFYDAVLATLGYRRVLERPRAIGYGTPGAVSPGFWLLDPDAAGAVRPGRGLHVAFRAGSRAAVHAFHEAALGAGARDAGPPGPRPEYSGGFYGAFAIDLDGFKIEAVHREPADG